MENVFVRTITFLKTLGLFIINSFSIYSHISEPTSLLLLLLATELLDIYGYLNSMHNGISL